MTESGSAKLGDFGIVALMDVSGTAAPSGDQLIWAPEFFTGGRATIASDIYAAAVTLYALLAGGMPFTGFTKLADLADAVHNGAYEPLRDVAPHVSQALADKVKIGMSLNPDDRFSRAAEFDNALALTPRARRFIPLPVHTGHMRCWTAVGRGAEIYVCAIQGPTARQVSILTTHADTGRRIRRLCCDTTLARLPTRLRAVFGELRDK